ncbi:MAG: bifunctional oligoribonuclease/PAP phosphatase NrnA, partial [Myxococcota bacterium]
MNKTATLRTPVASPPDAAIAPVLRLLQERDRFIVAGHRNPEGDALGSSIALGLALEEMGKQVIFYNAD